MPLSSNNNHQSRLQRLLAFHRKSLLTRNADHLTELVRQEVRDIVGAERATLFLLDRESGELYGKFAIGLQEDQLRSLRLPVGRGIAGQVALTGTPINAPDAYKNPHFNQEFDRITQFKTRSVLAVPLKDTSGVMVGVLAAFNKKDGVFDDDDEGLLLLLASQLAATFEIFQLLADLKLANLESIFALAQTAEYRDQEDTGPHIRRVSTYSAILAEAAGMPASEVEIIRVTSPLHDIGKVAIRDEILRKPGKFTPEEAEVMRQHSYYGFTMLKNFRSPLLRVAGKIALAHHEKFDGSGYPNKLKGEAIPIEARIVTIADAFDAMTSKRVYKSAMPLPDAFDELLKHAGRQFDPALVELCLKTKEILKAAHREGHNHDGASA